MSGNVSDDLARIAVSLRGIEGLTLPVILCFFTGRLPDYVSPMPRIPDPAVGMEFDMHIGKTLAEAVGLNSAIHDGAVLLGRASLDEEYRIAGWSYRLHPPSVAVNVVNKGSAFNSCLAMSALPSIDVLFLLAREGAFKFCEGRCSEL